MVREEAALETCQGRASRSGQLVLSRLTKRYPNQIAVDAIDLEVEGRRVPHAARPERLRQDDDAHDGRRIHPAVRGRHHARRRARSRASPPNSATSAWCSRTTRCFRT